MSRRHPLLLAVPAVLATAAALAPVSHAHARRPAQPPFAPLVVEGPLEERHIPTVKLEIAIGDVVVRTDAAIDGEQLSRVIRAVRASR